MNDTLEDLIVKYIPDIELIQELRNTRGAATWKIKQGETYHVLKASKLQLEETPKGYDHNQRIYTIEREATVLKALKSFNDSMYSFSGKNEALVWVATKWLEGASLSKRSKEIRDNADINDRKKKLLSLIIRLFEKVALLHEEGYLHGDLQPAHFLFDKEDNLYLLDFGLAKHVDEDALYKGSFVHFSAPEVTQKIIDGAENITYTTSNEIYAAASVAFLTYTGRTSTYYGTYDYRSLTYQEILKLIAERGASNTFSHAKAPSFPALEEILNWCLETSMEQRCPSIKEALKRLREISTTTLH